MRRLLPPHSTRGAEATQMSHDAEAMDAPPRRATPEEEAALMQPCIARVQLTHEQAYNAATGQVMYAGDELRPPSQAATPPDKLDIVRAAKRLVDHSASCTTELCYTADCAAIKATIAHARLCAGCADLDCRAVSLHYSHHLLHV